MTPWKHEATVGVLGPLRHAVTERAGPSAPAAEVRAERAARRAVRARAIQACDALGDSRPMAGLHSLGTIAWLLRNLPSNIRLLFVIARLPRLSLHLSTGPGGRAIMATARDYGRSRTLSSLGRSVYFVPESGLPFVGRAAHSRRSAANKVRKEGLRTLTVDEDCFNALLATLRSAPCEQPRCDGRNYAALNAAGSPIAVSHLHVDGHVAQLALSLHAHPDPSTGPARFALFQHVVEDLARSGVTVLLVLDNFFTMKPGLRQFQRLLGFVPVNLRLRAGGPPS